ncbi:MAG: hypothetical protein K8W52_37310 [Deltaproteobacteria bacterium]|nr:hypothetical protein [Deltaproteobacteria bacterium]
MTAIAHDASIRELRRRARAADAPAIAGAFVASLGAEPGAWRAPLVALAAGLAVPPPRAKETPLSAAIAREGLAVGNKHDRRHVIETLGACGVLETPEHPGFTTRWTTFAARQDRPSARTECDPPIAFWTAAHGVNAASVARWFGHLGVKVTGHHTDRGGTSPIAGRDVDPRRRARPLGVRGQWLPRAIVGAPRGSVRRVVRRRAGRPPARVARRAELC